MLVWKPFSVRLLWLAVTGLSVIYAICMFIAPVFIWRGSWTDIQEVWDRWQALNVGVLAFLASIIALRTVRLQERARARREFDAARAFLSQALSDLAEYCHECAILLIDARARSAGRVTDVIDRDWLIPVFPEDTYRTFDRIIQTAQATEAGYVATMISELQVHRSRIRGLVQRGSRGTELNRLTAHSATSYLAALVMIRAKIDVLLPFSRSEVPTINPHISERDIYTALRLLGLFPEQESELLELAEKLRQRYLAQFSVH